MARPCAASARSSTARSRCRPGPGIRCNTARWRRRSSGACSRQGRANALLEALEGHARSQGVLRLRTEASQLSRPLLLRRGWQIDDEETVLFAGVRFVRWRMGKPLQN